MGKWWRSGRLDCRDGNTAGALNTVDCSTGKDYLSGWWIALTSIAVRLLYDYNTIKNPSCCGVDQHAVRMEALMSISIVRRGRNSRTRSTLSGWSNDSLNRFYNPDSGSALYGVSTSFSSGKRSVRGFIIASPALKWVLSGRSQATRKACAAHCVKNGMDCRRPIM